MTRLFVLCCYGCLLLGNTSAEKEVVNYGVDVSFPMQRNQVIPGEELGDRQGFYNSLMDGCYKTYGKEKCDLSEQERIERNLRRPSAMVNFTTMVSQVNSSQLKSFSDLFCLIWKRKTHPSNKQSPF